MSRYTDTIQAHARQTAEQEPDDIRTVMQTQQGRRLFMRMTAVVYRQSVNGEDRAYTAGQRDAALEIVKAVNKVCPDKALQALTEQNHENSRRNLELQSAQAQDVIEKKGKP